MHLHLTNGMSQSLCGTRFRIAKLLDESPKTGKELVALDLNAPHHISGLKKQGLVYGIKHKRSWGACLFALTKKGRKLFNAANDSSRQMRSSTRY